SARELSVHSSFSMRQVEVVRDGRLLPAWYDVLDVVAQHDLVLASGHQSISEAVVLLRAARKRGVRRLLVNHPMMAFLGWPVQPGRELSELGVYLELGLLPDLLGPPENSSQTLAVRYPTSLLVFGGDLGHSEYPTMSAALPSWLHNLEKLVG